MNEAHYLKGPCQSCGNNIEFPESGLGSVVECPHCGQRTTLAVRTAPGKAVRDKPGLGFSILIGCVVLLVVVVAGFFLFTRDKPEMRAASESVPAKAVANSPLHTSTNAVVETGVTPVKSIADLKVGEISLEKTKGSSLVYAVGTIKNNSEIQRFGVKVTLKLLDQNGRKVGTAQDYIGVLEPHHDWQFRALITDPKAVTAVLDSIREEN